MSDAVQPSSAAIENFSAAWQASGGAERANCHTFIHELCDLLGVPRPEPTRPDDRDNGYVFERTVTLQHGDGSAVPNYIDLYKRGCFVLEAKQGSDKSEAALFPELARKLKAGTARRGTSGWDRAMQAAKNQAERYAKALPGEEGWPPFLVVVDVGHSIELFSEFSRTGKTYLPFPDPRSHRLALADLKRPEVRERLRLVWTEPDLLDPAKRSAKVTREVADRLARLAKSLEAAGHSAHKVGDFLKRCLFTLFAEDIGLIPNNGYTALLESLRGAADKYAPMAESLWQTMKDGGFSPVLREKLLRFNGGLFEAAEALPLSEEQLEMLILAGKADWRDVEPAIFGTLLERALDPTERHHLGAHYTPRDYVERLVLPTVVEPLRADWDSALAAAVTLAGQGKADEAVTLLKEFHRRLCALRILDPACGSGNFLYVTFEHLKRLEGEVLDALEGFGETQDLLGFEGTTVDPHQLLGIEVNPRAAAITDMVLWIGYLQWHFRTLGNVQPAEPVIKKFRNIECRDAVLTWEHTEPVLDENGNPVTRWDGVTTRLHPVTGEPVPDESARVPLLRYVNPKEAEWPEADYVVGNPPFIGNKQMRGSLGVGYVDALRFVWREVPDTADYVMYWWNKAADLSQQGKVRRFGFITTNSLTMVFNRRVVERHLFSKPPLSLIFAIPDHPWVDSADGASVRIAMSVGETGPERKEGTLATVNAEVEGSGEGVDVELVKSVGLIHPDLTTGANVSGAKTLTSNTGLSFMGMIPLGAGFWIDEATARNLGLGRIQSLDAHIRRYRNGKDLTDKPRGILALDFFGLTEEELRQKFPEAYQWLYERVKPQRDQDNRPSRRNNWWIFAESVPKFRAAILGLNRYIGTAETAKHRIFVFIDADILPDQKIRVIATDDAYVHGVLSSRTHLVWARNAGGTLEDRPVYNNTRCFEPFPFPDCSDGQKNRIRQLAEKLDSHRKRQQHLHEQLGLTKMYNVLEKLRTGEALTAKEKTLHEQGLVAVLKQLHDELDAAVAEAYGWPVNLADETILERLVDLNRQRAKEEEQGLVRWLRPEYQNPAGSRSAAQEALLETESETAPTAAVREKSPWPANLPQQVAVVRAALAGQPAPVTARELKEQFKNAREPKVREILAALASIGQAREMEDGRYVS